MNPENLLHDLFIAYYDARQSKRNTANQLDFEFNLERNLIQLYAVKEASSKLAYIHGLLTRGQ